MAEEEVPECRLWTPALCRLFLATSANFELDHVSEGFGEEMNTVRFQTTVRGLVREGLEAVIVRL